VEAQCRTRCVPSPPLAAPPWHRTPHTSLPLSSDETASRCTRS
jgi:hypothetical protein